MLILFIINLVKLKSILVARVRRREYIGGRVPLVEVDDNYCDKPSNFLH
jgi:hypothetical protein